MEETCEGHPGLLSALSLIDTCGVQTGGEGVAGGEAVGEDVIQPSGEADFTRLRQSRRGVPTELVAGAVGSSGGCCVCRECAEEDTGV